MPVFYFLVYFVTCVTLDTFIDPFQLKKKPYLSGIFLLTGGKLQCQLNKLLFYH